MFLARARFWPIRIEGGGGGGSKGDLNFRTRARESGSAPGSFRNGEEEGEGGGNQLRTDIQLHYTTDLTVTKATSRTAATTTKTQKLHISKSASRQRKQ